MEETENNTVKIEKLEKIEELDNNVLSSIDALLKLSKDEDGEIRMRAIESLAFGITSEIQKRVIEGLFDSYDLVKITSLEIVGNWKDLTYEDIVINCLNDDNWLVRSAAAISLSEMNSIKAINML